MTDTGAHLPYANNCVALSLSKTLSLSQAEAVRKCIETYSCITKWSDLEEDRNLKVIFSDTKHWTPLKVGGGTWSDIKKLCQAYHGGKHRFFAIHWGVGDKELWGAPKRTFHAICIQVKGGSVVIFGNNSEPQVKRNPEQKGHDYKQTSSQYYSQKIMKDTDWVSAWRPV